MPGEVRIAQYYSKQSDDRLYISPVL